MTQDKSKLTSNKEIFTSTIFPGCADGVYPDKPLAWMIHVYPCLLNVHVQETGCALLLIEEK